MATSLEKSQKLNDVNKPFRQSASAEILVKLGPLASEKQVLESRPLKYSPSGKFAERAKLEMLGRV